MKAIIFDLGNVLVHYDGRATFLGLSQLTAVSLEAIYAHYQTIDYDFGTGQFGGRDYFASLQESFGLRASYDTFAATFCRYQQRHETALRFARNLQAQSGVKVGIISNTNEIHASWLRANLPELAQFSSVILSHEVGLLKPDPAIFQLSLAQLDLPTDRALFVDDLAENVAGGTAVGLAGLQHTGWRESRMLIENWLTSGMPPRLPA